LLLGNKTKKPLVFTKKARKSKEESLGDRPFCLGPFGSEQNPGVTGNTSHDGYEILASASAE
jgi:hypothetical protein